MALQFILVNDASPGAVVDAGMTSDETDITSTLGWVGTTGTFSSTLDVTGNSTFGGTVGVTGNVAVNTDKFTVAAASGNTLVAGTFEATGAQTLTGATSCASTLGVAGVASFAAGVAFGGTENAACHGAQVVPITKGYQGYTTDATSAIAATLADGAVGQRLFIKLTAKDTNNMVVTPANLTGGTTLTFDATGEYCELMFIGTSGVMLYGTCTLA